MRVSSLGMILDAAWLRGDRFLGEFAQSPQAIEMDGFVRVYFCTRSRDETGMYLSHVTYVDMSEDFRELLHLPKHEVLTLGRLGTFDEHGIFPFSPYRAGPKLLACTTGWSRRSSVAVETAIGLVESGDGGHTFERLGEGPVAAGSLFEPFLVGDAFVREYEGQFHMWYIFGTHWLDSDSGAPERVYKIGQAWSSDGLRFEGFNGVSILPDILGETECQALPTVAFFGDRYHMFFCYREACDFRDTPSRGYRLGYASSKDLRFWHRDDGAISWSGRRPEFDAEMVCYPHVTVIRGKPYLLYNGNAFGRSGFGVAEITL